MRVLSYSDLLSLKGISYSKAQLWRLVRTNEFPTPVKLGANRNAWPEHEIDDWLQGRIDERDAQKTAE